MSDQVAIRPLALRVSNVFQLQVTDLGGGVQEIARIDWAPLQTLVDGLRSVTDAWSTLLYAGRHWRGRRQHHGLVISPERAALDRALDWMAGHAASGAAEPSLRWMLEEHLDWPALRTCYGAATGRVLRTKRDWAAVTDIETHRLMIWQAAARDTGGERDPAAALHRLLCEYQGISSPADLQRALDGLSAYEQRGPQTRYMRPVHVPAFGAVLSDRDRNGRRVAVQQRDGRLEAVAVMAANGSSDYQYASLDHVDVVRFDDVRSLCAWMDALPTERHERGSYSYAGPEPAQTTPRFRVVWAAGDQSDPAQAVSQWQIGRIDHLGQVLAQFRDPTPTTYDRQRRQLDWLPEHRRKDKTPRSKPLAKELRAHAKQLGIRGASRMNERELQLTIAQHTIDQFEHGELADMLDGGAFVSSYAAYGSYSYRDAVTVDQPGAPMAVLARRLPGGFAHRGLAPQAARVAGSEPREAVAFRPLNPFCAASS